MPHTMLRRLALAALIAVPLGCATASGGASGGARTGTLTFTRADSLTMSGTELVAVRGEPGGGLVLLDAGPGGCGPITPWGTYIVDGTLVRVSLSGIDRVMVCRDAASGARRHYVAHLRGLDAGTYDVVFTFAGEGAAWTPLYRTLVVP